MIRLTEVQLGEICSAYYCNCSGSPAAYGRGVWCGGETTTPQSTIPLQIE